MVDKAIPVETVAQLLGHEYISNRKCAVEDLVTPSNKTVKIVHIANTNLYGYSIDDGKRLGDGLFTDATRAHENARAYVESLWEENDRAKIDAKRDARAERAENKRPELAKAA